MRLLTALALLLLALSPARANDGFGGISATGLTFAQTDAVSMESEDLYISRDKVRVTYVFRNLTDRDVTGEIIFPLPPVRLAELMEFDWNLPIGADGGAAINFTATVDGTDVPVNIDRIAVIAAPYDSATPARAQYDSPGPDVTATLARYGIPVSLNVEEVMAVLDALDAATLGELEDLGLVDYDPGYGSTPLWSVVSRYHWTQTFPAGAETEIRHAYDNAPAGGLFGWAHPPEDYMAEFADLYCIDDGTSRALAKVLARKDDGGETYSLGTAYYLSYVLRTANSWAGPIKRFKLTLDKGDPGNIISLCVNGIKKTGPTTFVVEKTDYVPERDLDILIVSPMPD